MGLLAAYAVFYPQRVKRLFCFCCKKKKEESEEPSTSEGKSNKVAPLRNKVSSNPNDSQVDLLKNNDISKEDNLLRDNQEIKEVREKLTSSKKSLREGVGLLEISKGGAAEGVKRPSDCLTSQSPEKSKDKLPGSGDSFENPFKLDEASEKLPPQPLELKKPSISADYSIPSNPPLTDKISSFQPRLEAPESKEKIDKECADEFVDELIRYS